MSISKNVGAITNILSHFYGNKIKESLKNPVSTAPFFEQFGLSYVGPIDGHDTQKLIDTLESLKGIDHPTILHVLTVKGKGMENATNNPTPYHGAKPFNRVTGEFYPPKTVHPTFPKIFGKHLFKMAEEDPSIVAITPAMPVGSCLSAFMKRFPDRCIDVGIAEGHSLTYAGGIGRGGKLKVVATIYSSFLQRAHDSIYHDICVQRSPIVIAIDRAGLATGDGVTAQGLYDIAFLNSMPNMVIAQPRNGHLLKELLESAFDWNQPTAIRYPNLSTTDEDAPIQKRELGKGEILAEGEEVIIVSLGHMSEVALSARALLLEEGIEACVIDPIFVKPLDEELLLKKLHTSSTVITIEEHALRGGLGSIINNFIVQQRLTHLTVKNFGIPDVLVEHGSHAHLLEKFGITPRAICDEVLRIAPKTTAV